MNVMSVFRRSGRHSHARTEDNVDWPGLPAPDKPHGVATPQALAALVSRAEAMEGDGWAGASGPGQMPTLPYALSAPPQHAPVLPPVPLTEEAVIFDALGGQEKAARPCGHCGALSGRRDLSWRYDAHQVWSCPACQLTPGWRSPFLPGLRTPATGEPGWEEERIMAWAKLATDPRSVRQRPDGKWTAAIPISGRQRRLGVYGSKEEAEAAYGYALHVFAEATREQATA